jgi:hypothetical protein
MDHPNDHPPKQGLGHIFRILSLLGMFKYDYLRYPALIFKARHLMISIAFQGAEERPGEY